jgi:hypothetical protein
VDVADVHERHFRVLLAPKETHVLVPLPHERIAGSVEPWPRIEDPQLTPLLLLLLLPLLLLPLPLLLPLLLLLLLLL